jgi:nucleotide-binding universal stress UspA family protein
MFSKILIATDGSKGALKAVQVAVMLAQVYEAELHVITVEERLPQHEGSVVSGELRPKGEAQKHLQRVILQAGMIATSYGLRMTPHIMRGHEVEMIVRFIEKHAVDLLVVGFSGHSKILDNEWGSTSQNLTRIAQCSVLVVK